VTFEKQRRVRLVRVRGASCPELDALVGAEGEVEAVIAAEPPVLVRFDGGARFYCRRDEIEEVTA